MGPPEKALSFFLKQKHIIKFVNMRYFKTKEGVIVATSAIVKIGAIVQDNQGSRYAVSLDDGSYTMIDVEDNIYYDAGVIDRVAFKMTTGGQLRDLLILSLL